MDGGRNVERYREAGINWWDYCRPILVNSYPTCFEKLPPLIDRINKEQRNSKNYALFLGETGVGGNQASCLSFRLIAVSWSFPPISGVRKRISVCRQTSIIST